MSDRRVEFWAVQDTEDLRHRTLDEAVGEYLDDLAPLGWPETVTVTGYARREVHMPMFDCARGLLEVYVGDLHDEYGYDPEGPEAWALASNAEITIVLDVLRALHDRFEPCLCDPVTSEVVDVEAWVEQHKPHWLAVDVLEQHTDMSDEVGP